MYFPVSTAGYAVYGNQVQSNVLSSVSHGTMKTIVTILITLHLLFGFIIVINPFSQEVEHLLKIEERKYRLYCIICMRGSRKFRQGGRPPDESV